MGNEERNETINELYGSVQDTHNYGKTYYYQQAKEIAAVTAIAMIRDGVPPVDIRICIDNWYGVEIPEHAMKILEAEAKSDEEEEQLTGKRRTDLSPSAGSARPSACVNVACRRISFTAFTQSFLRKKSTISVPVLTVTIPEQRLIT